MLRRPDRFRSVPLAGGSRWLRRALGAATNSAPIQSEMAAQSLGCCDRGMLVIFQRAFMSRWLCRASNAATRESGSPCHDLAESRRLHRALGCCDSVESPIDEASRFVGSTM